MIIGLRVEDACLQREFLFAFSGSRQWDGIWGARYLGNTGQREKLNFDVGLTELSPTHWRALEKIKPIRIILQWLERLGFYTFTSVTRSGLLWEEHDLVGWQHQVAYPDGCLLATGSIVGQQVLPSRGIWAVFLCIYHIGETNMGVIEITQNYCVYVRRGLKINLLAFMGWQRKKSKLRCLRRKDQKKEGHYSEFLKWK